jgi:hypothetical protein
MSRNEIARTPALWRVAIAFVARALVVTIIAFLISACAAIGFAVASGI